MKNILIFQLLILFVCPRLFAQEEVRNSRAYANHLIIPGSFIQSYDDKFTITSGFTNMSNRAVVELGLDEDKHLAQHNGIKFCAKFDVEIIDAAQLSTTLTNQQLDINYDPTDLSRYKDKAQLVFNDIYKLRVYNISITSCSLNTNCSSCTSPYMLSDVYLQAEIATSRNYNFGFTSTFTSGDLKDSFPSNDQLKITWPFLEGATEYELEYTFIDDYNNTVVNYVDANSLTYDFRHDATRIVTPKNVYYIPLTYERGFIVYRVRPIGENTNKQRMEGAWFPTASSGTVANATHTVYINPSFPKDILSWQSVKTFAESGKTGVGVSYNDALGLPRQNLARLNDESKTIAESTLFDFYARPTINILPSPVSGNNFTYRFGLNIHNSVVFDKLIFDDCTTNNICSPAGFTLNPTASLGAANYYSPQNANKEKQQGYLPDAFGFPYTQVKYTDDGLNRIARQSLPGDQHFLGSGKDIEYRYSKPTQVELDRLFGAAAGRSKFYHQTSTRDPNAQNSVTYSDFYGRTVATFLRGKNPTSVDALPNITGTVSLTEDYSSLPKNKFDYTNNCREVEENFEILQVGNEEYIYSASWEAFLAECDQMCYNCVYDLSISIVDECGTEVFDYDSNNSTPQGYTGTIGESAPYNSNSCAGTSTMAAITGTAATSAATITLPRPGKYTIRKKICVNDAPLDSYTKMLLSDDNCIVDKCTIFNDELNKVDFSGCDMSSCQSCTASVAGYVLLAAGNSTAILVNGVLTETAGTIPSTITIFNTPTLTSQEISQLYEDCDLACAASDICTTYERLMLSDFYPSTGQFAATSSLAATWSLSIFNSTNAITSASPVWSTTAHSYSNSILQLDFVEINGVNVNPKELEADEFELYFKKSWAKTFMQYHPDNCKKYFYCQLLTTSIAYDENMNSVNHFDKACALGYVTPIAFGSYSSYKPSGTCASTVDPIVALATARPGFASAIATFTNAITGNFRGSSVDIYKYLALQSNSAVAIGGTGDFFGDDECTADHEWMIFKDYYINAKRRLYYDLLTIFLASPNSYGYGSTSCGTMPVGAKSHFPDYESFFSTNFPSTGTNTPNSSLYLTAISPPSDFATTTNTATIANYTNALSQFTTNTVATATALALECESACNSYTAVWSINLTAACPAFSTASTGTKDAILAAMLEICKLGCDYMTSMEGASTAPPGQFYTLPSTSHTVNSFQGILDYYLGSAACNAIVIDGPIPYPAPGGTVSPGDLSSCKCDVILNVAHDFTATTIPSGINYEWELFENYYGFDLADYYKLKCFCLSAADNTWSPGHTWTSNQENALITYTIPITEQFVCSSCIACDEVATIIDGLTLPVTSTYTTLYDKITKVPGNQIFVLNTLNAVFGLNYLQRYMDLYADCHTFTTGSSYTYSNSITDRALDLYKILDHMVEEKTLTKNRVMTLCEDSKYHFSSLYTGNLPIVPGYSYNPITNSNTLTIHITLFTQTITSIQLVKPSTHTLSWSNLKSLSNFFAYTPPPLVSGPNYGFKVSALDDDLTTIVIEGIITNSAFPISYLSYGTSTVPAICPEAEIPEKDQCAVNLINNVISNTNLLYEQEVKVVVEKFKQDWRNNCLNTLAEKFERRFSGGDDYNFTLYYYDQAGNLQRTVPPNGVDPGKLSSVTSELPSSSTSLPAYNSVNGVAQNFVNDYRYDSYNNLIQENTVDGGLTTYHYDAAGRLMASQNAKQAANSGSGVHIYSYSLYDGIGRVIEYGEVQLSSITSPILSEYGNFSMAVQAAAATKREITHVYYDRATTTSSVLAAFSGSTQKHLRNRVSYVTFMKVYSSTVTDYDQATYYSYDEHGNVTEIVQHNKQLDLFNQGLRNIQYEFELISGNILKATYQKNRPDQFIHKYNYDEDNRLKEVFTSKDNINWDRDAKYFYYEHGPLARVERADKKVQASDYFYTIHGWLKAINSDGLTAHADPGKDGSLGNSYLASYSSVHRWFPSDATGFSLNYYNTSTTADYKPIKSFSGNDKDPLMSIASFSTNTNPFYMDDNSANLAGDGADLFNGNISSMNTSIIDKDPSNTIADDAPFPLLSAFRYDQLHRIKKSKTFRSYNASILSWNAGTSGNYDDAYRMNFSYDNNGNILSLLRKGPGSNIIPGSNIDMDDLSYSYYNTYVLGLAYNSNKLRCVNDAISASNYSEDIDDFACDWFESITEGPSISYGERRYEYDEIGNLKADFAECLGIEWTIDRKVKKITRDPVCLAANGMTNPDVEYEYNTSRQRVTKIVKPHDPITKDLLSSEHWIYTYYVYDASGNVMATYQREAEHIGSDVYSDNLSLQENHVYGSERLALSRPSNTLATWSYNFYLGCEAEDCRFLPLGDPSEDPITPESESGYKVSRHLGFKDFELTNHLGNVLTTVSDRKIQSDFDPNVCVAEYNFTAGVPSNNLMNPENIIMSTSGGSLVCTANGGHNSGINPQFGPSLVAAMVYTLEFDFDPGNNSNAFFIFVYDLNKTTNQLYTTNSIHILGAPIAGHYTYTYTPTQTGPDITTHVAFNIGIGNSTTHWFKVDNIKLCTEYGAAISYSADIVSNTDYYPGGQAMPGRTWVGGDQYRYSHNGHEREGEIYEGAQSAEYWMYDSRILRRWERDPIVKEWESPYACFNGNPIYYADPKGLDGEGGGGPKGGEPKVGSTHFTNNTFNTGQNGGMQLDGPFSRGGVSNGAGLSGNLASPRMNLPVQGIGGGGLLPPKAYIGPWVIPAIQAIEAAIVAMTGGAVAHAAITYPYATTTKEESNRWLVYRITYEEVSKETGAPIAFNKVYKYGISGQNFNTDGTHPRPKIQTDALNSLEATIAGDESYTTIRRYKSEVILQNVSKLAAEFMEQEAINVYYSAHGEKPEGNKRPLPDPLRGRARKKFDQINQKVNPDQLNKIKNFLKKL